MVGMAEKREIGEGLACGEGIGGGERGQERERERWECEERRR
jgi:hypothetical protein